MINNDRFCGRALQAFLNERDAIGRWNADVSGTAPHFVSSR